MDFERFDKLARTDRVLLLTALELLWQNGRAAIQSEDVSGLTASCVSSLGTFYTREKLREAVTVCKELAHLETADLIRCIRGNGMETKDPDAEDEGICPICGGELEYGDDEPLDNGGVYDWTCSSCGATGKEGYSKVFDRHYDVRDGDGNPYPAQPGGGERLAEPAPATCVAKPPVMVQKSVNALPPEDVERLRAYFPKEDWNAFFWGFTCFSRQDYAAVVPIEGVNEILLGLQCREGGTLGELAVRWYILGGKPALRLEVFDEAWPVTQTPTFAAFIEELTQMSRRHAPTPDEVSALLIAHGFTDQSDRPLSVSKG